MTALIDGDCWCCDDPRADRCACVWVAIVGEQRVYCTTHGLEFACRIEWPEPHGHITGDNRYGDKGVF